PEVMAMFSLSDQTGIDPLDIRGSGSGAFGMPQFLPSSYLRFAVDGNRDGRISLYDPPDATASAANYLARHGWRPGLSYAQQRQVIWTYNHSDPYIDTVLYLAARIEETNPSRLTVASDGPRRSPPRMKRPPPKVRPAQPKHGIKRRP